MTMLTLSSLTARWNARTESAEEEWLSEVMISILRPSAPPFALISSAAIWAACGIDAPAIACASAMTPILIGSAANAGLAATSRPSAVAPRSACNDREIGNRELGFILFLSLIIGLFRCL